MIQGIDRFFHFSYLRQDVRGMPDIHELRDGDAFAELAALLASPKREYGGLLLNYPSPAAKMPSFTSRDLLVLTTRPPLTDDDLDSRPIRRSGTALERTVLQTVQRAFRICRRSYVMLSEEMAQRLPDSHKNRAEMEFTLNGPACCKRYRRPYTKKKTEHQWHAEPTDSLRTAAFLLSSTMPNGAVLLNAFSMDGPATLVWCYLLRTRFPELIASDRFVMADLVPPGPLPERPVSLSFAQDWTVDILLDQPLVELPEKRFLHKTASVS